MRDGSGDGTSHELSPADEQVGPSEHIQIDDLAPIACMLFQLTLATRSTDAPQNGRVLARAGAALVTTYQRLRPGSTKNVNSLSALGSLRRTFTESPTRIAGQHVKRQREIVMER